MKRKFIRTLFLSAFLTNVIFAQDAQKISFDVLTEDGFFYKEVKSSDIQIKGTKDLSLKLKSDVALEIVIMIDTSASQEKTLPFEKKAAQTFVNEFLKKGKDKVSVVSFSGKVSVEQNLTDDLIKAAENINKIEFVPPSGYIGGGIVVGKPSPINDPSAAGSTSIWDSTKQVLEAFSKIPSTDAQRAVILISDGLNTYGESKLKEVVESSSKIQIPVYTIGIGDELYDGIDKKSLKKVSEESGGIAIFPKKKLDDISSLLKMIEQSLRSSYELTFPRIEPNSQNKKQTVEIEIINPELKRKKLKIIQPETFSVQ